MFNGYQARRPVVVLDINGISTPFIDIERSTPSYYEASTFEINLAQKACPDAMNNDFWDYSQAYLVEIYSGFASSNVVNKNDLSLVFTGQIDDLDIDLATGIIFASGRDLTAKFIDNKTTEKFQNQTFSQVAEILAKRRGLKTNIVPTTTPVGYYYSNDHVSLNVERTEWDILASLAQKEGYLVFVDGQTLNCVPIPKETENLYNVSYQQPASTNESPVFGGVYLKTHRTMTIAKDIIVEVRSWNQKQKKGFTIRLKGQPNKKTYLSQKAQPIGDAQVFTREVGGLTREQALQLAQQILEQESRFQLEIEIEMPGDDNIKQDTVLNLTGTGRVYDQVYYPSRVTRKHTLNGGYTMTVEAKNHTPISQVLL